MRREFSAKIFRDVPDIAERLLTRTQPTMIRSPMLGRSVSAVSSVEARMAQRSGWHQINGKWTRTLGERGCRVRLFQNRRDGVFYRATWITGQGKDRRSLNTTDRAQADRLGKALLGELRRPTETAERTVRRLTLSDLWERFRTTCVTYKATNAEIQADATRRAAILIAHFGAKCDVRDLMVDDIAAFRLARRAGGIRVSDQWTTQPVRARSVVEDLALLQRMLNWARTTRVDGVRLLDANPIAGIRTPRDRRPRRPLATWDRFLATRAAMRQYAAEAETPEERARWIKGELTLVLAEGTGRRLGAIAHQCWENINWDLSTIRWVADFDKKGKDWVTPVPKTLLAEIRGFQRELGAIAGWIVASESDPTKPMDRYALTKLLAKAERRAGLPKLDGGLWHPYRRKWATERKHLALVDVAEAGGWLSTVTLATCYQQPTSDVLLAVMSEERKVRDVAIINRT
jgi:hypothetical protein